ncbi:unnamed protein product [Cochlearia groenlandica]
MRSYNVNKDKKKLRVSYVFIACVLFLFIIICLSFLNLFSQGFVSEIKTRRSLNKETEDSSVLNIPFKVLSWSPRIFYLPDFATKQQCQAIIDMAKPKLKPSGVALRIGESAESQKDVRTSSDVFIDADEDETGVLAAIDAKISQATKIPTDHYEAFNILRYRLGQKYDSHYDAFNPAEYGTQRSQRVVSFLLYLSSVEEGGETMFPFENGRNMNGSYDYEKCIGLKVKPRRGDAIFFYNLFPNGTRDERSLHGSCPVIKGDKWVATKWIRDHTYQDYED